MLLNENRNRIPQVENTPNTGTTAGKRGDVRMLSSTELILYICLNSGPIGPGSSVIWGTMDITAL